MLDNSYWKEYNDGERAYLWSADGEKIAFIQKKDTVWDCIVWPQLIAENFYYNGMSSIEEVEWQITLYIYNKCNNIANQLHRIRDTLPSIHELAELAEKAKKECEVYGSFMVAGNKEE